MHSGRLLLPFFALSLAGCHLLVPLGDLQSDEGAAGTTGTGGTPGDETPACSPEPATITHEWFVAANGDDAARGTVDAPFLTVTHAVSQSAAGDVIRLGPGEFQETSTVELPPGVSLVGAGAPQTTLKVSAGIAVLRVVEATEATVSSLTLDGNGRATAEGLRLEGARDVTVARMGFVDLGEAGLHVLDGAVIPSGLLVCGSTFTNCASSNATFSPYEDTGCIQTQQLADTVLSDLVIHESLGTGSGIRIEPAADGSVTNLLLHGLDVQVQATRDGSAPEYALTLRVVSFDNVEIRRSRFNNAVALWQVGSDAQTLRIHDNVFEPLTAALDLDVSGAAIDHNYFRGGYYALFSYNSGETKHDVLVHHNIFTDQSAPALLTRELPALDRFFFYNNTVHVGASAADAPLFEFQQGGTGHEYRNNVFWSDEPGTNALGVPVGSVVSQNLFFNLDPGGYGDNFDTDPPLLDASYRPLPGSPLIGAGAVIPNVSGPAPVDIGACTAGSEPCPAP
jgi:hypothetical protein